jgi:NAD(P)H-hydrate epimerase
MFVRHEILRLTRAQVRDVDRRAIEHYHVPGIVLMENAARGAADVAWEMVRRMPGALVDVICGGGNNGGDGFAIARHLHNRGAWASVILAADPGKVTGDAQVNARILQAMKITFVPPEDAERQLKRGNSELLIDALFGTGLQQAPREPAARVIQAMNAKGLPILAVDLPSGLDCDTGEPLGPDCVRATRTVTFVAEKSGFANPASRPYTGEITVADIGCPREAIVDVLRDISADPPPPP